MINKELLASRIEEIKMLKIVKLPDGRFDVWGDVDFSCLGLTSLKELPIKIRRVHGKFDCSGNQLTSLEGAAQWIARNFYIINNPKKFTEEEVLSIVKVEGDVFV